MDCTNIPEATKMATELYREAIHVPFMAKFVVFSKRHQLEEARVRVFCMTDDKEDKTLESQEHFIEVAKSRDVEVLEGKSQYLEFAGNLIPVTKSGDQLAFNFYAFRENRLPFTVRVKDQNAEPVGRLAFMRQPKVGRGEAPQSPICTLNLSLPDNIQPEPAPSEPDLLALEKKYAFLSISKADTIHKADLRLSDISNMLASDWVALAKELDISDSDINIIKTQYPDNTPQQAIVMLRLWMQTSGNKATGNTLEKALRAIHRDDIVEECICNMEIVTDVSEKATAEEVLEKKPQSNLVEEITPAYDEKDIMKDAESVEEEEIAHKTETVSIEEEQEVSELPVVPQPRSSNIHPTSQIIVESVRQLENEDDRLHEVYESDLRQRVETEPYEQVIRKVSDSKESSDLQEIIEESVKLTVDGREILLDSEKFEETPYPDYETQIGKELKDIKEELSESMDVDQLSERIEDTVNEERFEPLIITEDNYPEVEKTHQLQEIPTEVYDIKDLETNIHEKHLLEKEYSSSSEEDIMTEEKDEVSYYSTQKGQEIPYRTEEESSTPEILPVKIQEQYSDNEENYQYQEFEEEKILDKHAKISDQEYDESKFTEIETIQRREIQEQEHDRVSEIKVEDYDKEENMQNQEYPQVERIQDQMYDDDVNIKHEYDQEENIEHEEYDQEEKIKEQEYYLVEKTHVQEQELDQKLKFEDQGYSEKIDFKEKKSDENAEIEGVRIQEQDYDQEMFISHEKDNKTESQDEYNKEPIHEDFDTNVEKQKYHQELFIKEPTDFASPEIQLEAPDEFEIINKEDITFEEHAIEDTSSHPQHSEYISLVEDVKEDTEESEYALEKDIKVHGFDLEAEKLREHSSESDVERMSDQGSDVVHEDDHVDIEKLRIAYERDEKELVSFLKDEESHELRSESDVDHLSDQPPDDMVHEDEAGEKNISGHEPIIVHESDKLDIEKSETHEKDDLEKLHELSSESDVEHLSDLEPGMVHKDSHLVIEKSEVVCKKDEEGLVSSVDDEKLYELSSDLVTEKSEVVCEKDEEGLVSSVEDEKLYELSSESKIERLSDHEPGIVHEDDKLDKKSEIVYEKDEEIVSGLEGEKLHEHTAEIDAEHMSDQGSDVVHEDDQLDTEKSRIAYERDEKELVSGLKDQESHELSSELDVDHLSHHSPDDMVYEDEKNKSGHELIMVHESDQLDIEKSEIYEKDDFEEELHKSSSESDVEHLSDHDPGMGHEDSRLVIEKSEIVCEKDEKELISSIEDEKLHELISESKIEHLSDHEPGIVHEDDKLDKKSEIVYEKEFVSDVEGEELHELSFEPDVEHLSDQEPEVIHEENQLDIEKFEIVHEKELVPGLKDETLHELSLESDADHTSVQKTDLGHEEQVATIGKYEFESREEPVIVSNQYAEQEIQDIGITENVLESEVHQLENIRKESPDFEIQIKQKYDQYPIEEIEVAHSQPDYSSDEEPPTTLGPLGDNEFSFENKYFQEYDNDTEDGERVPKSEFLIESETTDRDLVQDLMTKSDLKEVSDTLEASDEAEAQEDDTEKEAISQDGLTQPSAETSQMEVGQEAPSDVKPPTASVGEQPTTDLQLTDKEIGEHKTKPDESSKPEDVGVVFTERKESGGGEKLPSETKGGQLSSAPSTSLISHTSSPSALQSHDEMRPQKRHERTYSQASNIISTSFHSDNGLGQLSEVDSSIEDSIKPYSERKQFWETVSLQSFETKSPVGKSETESDTDTGTDGTVIEKSKIEKEASIIEQSDSEHDSSQKKEDSMYENVVTYREKKASPKDSKVIQDLPSPEDISLKDVKTKKEMFEKEIKRQSSELEESLSWKRSSKEYEDDSSSDSPRSSGAFVSEKIILSSDATSVSEKQIEKKISERKTDEDVLRSVEETEKETSKLTEISKTEKEVYEKTVKEDDKMLSEKEVTVKKGVDKEIKDDLEKSTYKSREEKEDGSVVKKKVKETSTAHTSHELSEGKSETVVTDYDKKIEKTSMHTSSSVSSVDFRETSSTNLITSETTVDVKSPLGVASRVSSSTDSNNGSFERSDSTKESFDKSGSLSGTGSSLSKKQSTLTSSADERELSEFPEDSSQTSEDESNKIVEKKVEEERRKFGDTEEILVREITTTREGDQEQRVIKETKTQETLMQDGSTVKTTSVTTFTTQLDRNDSEDTVDQSEESSSSITEKEKSDFLLKQIKADMMTDAMHIPSDEISPEHKLLSPEDSKPVEQDQILSSPIHVPEESVQDIVWEVSQEQSDVPISETVQYISDETEQPSGESKVKFEEEKLDTKIVLTEDEARNIAREIVEEVKNEALKRSPIAEKEYIVNRVQIEERTFLPKPSSASAFSSETSSKLEKYIQEQLIDETLDEKHLSLLESVAAKKTEMLRKRIGASEVQLSLEITDEDLKSSEAELSPIETHMERLRQMTEEEELKSGREPSEADESESSMIIHDTLEETYTSGYDQANQMFNKTLDNVKSISLKGERAISTICEETEESEKQHVAEISSQTEIRKQSREELTEAAIEIVKEITDRAKESEILKQMSVDHSKEYSEPGLKESKKSLREDLLKHDKSLEIQMESSMTESVEECSAAESTRAYDSRYSTETPRTSTHEVTDLITDKKPVEIVTPPTDEIRLRKKKSHIDEFNRKSATDIDAYSSSGESHYFTAAEGSDSRSVSRPCSSDVEALLSGTPGTSEYETALTSQDGSQYSRVSSSSRSFSTAPSDISSRDSMKSIDSESSGNLGSIELSSEASETLVPSALDLEKDMEIIDRDILEEEMLRYEEKVHSEIPQLTVQSETPKDEDIPSPFDTETDDLEYETKEEDIPFVSSKMKRSMEMTFHPEPKLLKEEDQDDYGQIGLEESTISDLSVTTVIERDRNILESSGEFNMASSNISDQQSSIVETKEASTEHSSSVGEELLVSDISGTRNVTITTTTIPPEHPGQTTMSICTQVTSETVTEKSDDSFFRINGPTEEKYISTKGDEINYERPADVPMSSDDQELIGATGGHSVGPDSSYVGSFEPEADQEYGQMIREGEDLDILDKEIQHAVDSQPEDELDTVYLGHSDPIERPKTPEPGIISKLRINASQDSEELTEVDKRFSAIFSITYEEPASPALTTKEVNDNVPDITITEHMAPLEGKYRYPDLECDDEFPECRQNETETTAHSTPSSVTSPKSSTTDSEHGREYCLDSQTEGPVHYSEYGSFEVLEAGDISDIKEYENTILFHERRLRDLTIKEEDEVSSQGSKKDDSPVLLPSIIKAVKLDSESPSSSGDGDVAKEIDDVSYSSSIEEQRRWLEMQFEENARKASEFEFTQQSLTEHVYSGPLEDIEEEKDDYERRDLSHLTKTSSLSSTPEYDVLAGRKFFTRSGEQDDVSMSSLQEFEHIETEVAIDQATRRSSSGSQESLNGKRPGSGNKSLHGDDISVSSFSSLNEFERLEKECIMIEQIETKVKAEEKILSEIEEGHESQVSESESCETISDAGEESPDNYDQKLFEIDEIIRQAQTNVEKFDKDGVSLKDIVGISCSTDDRTPSVEPQDSLEETCPISKIGKDFPSHVRLPDKSSEIMNSSSDSLESKQAKDLLISSSDSLEDKRKAEKMSTSVDSLENDKRDLMATSADSLGRDDSSGREGDISSESERITHQQGGVMEWSTDSLEPTSSQATHATYQYETDSVMSGSFTSGCSTTLMPSVDEVSDLMSTSMYIPEGELPDDSSYGACSISSSNKYEWTKIKPEGIIKETIEESSEPEYSQTVTRTITLPPDVKHVTFTGPDAKEKLEEYIQRFDAGEHVSESETVDSAGNVHVEKIVQKRIVIDPTYADQEGIVLSEPEVEESFVKDSHGNVTRVVRRTVISTHTVEIDLDTGEPIIRRESSASPDCSHTHSISTTIPSQPSCPPSGSHSPREPLPTSLEPNTASDCQLLGPSTIDESYGEMSDEDDDPSLTTVTETIAPSFNVNITTTTYNPTTTNTISSSSATCATTSVDPDVGVESTNVTIRSSEERKEIEGVTMNKNIKDETLRNLDNENEEY